MGLFFCVVFTVAVTGLPPPPSPTVVTFGCNDTGKGKVAEWAHDHHLLVGGYIAPGSGECKIVSLTGVGAACRVVRR